MYKIYLVKVNQMKSLLVDLFGELVENVYVEFYAFSTLLKRIFSRPFKKYTIKIITISPKPIVRNRIGKKNSLKIYLRLEFQKIFMICFVSVNIFKIQSFQEAHQSFHVQLYILQ